jgi:ubiquinone/menaquinone biosynthesis C-methylase UbiE
MVNSFDNRAATWDENPRRIKLVEKVSNLILKEIDFHKTDEILDYGCGTGLLGYSLIDKVGSITFCDSSSGMLEQVEKKRDYYGYQNIKILNADFSLIEKIEQSYNFIFSMLVMHHVVDLKLILSKFHEALKEGGSFCWIDLDKEDGSFHNDDTIPHFGFDKEATIQLLKEAGFETTFYSNELLIKKEINEELRSFPLFVLIAQKA